MIREEKIDVLVCRLPTASNAQASLKRFSSADAMQGVEGALQRAAELQALPRNGRRGQRSGDLSGSTWQVAPRLAALLRPARSCAEPTLGAVEADQSSESALAHIGSGRCALTICSRRWPASNSHDSGRANSANRRGGVGSTVGVTCCEVGVSK